MKKESGIIVVTGAESTGKSVLTQWLAHHFKAPFIPEYARSYIEKLNRRYNYRDVEFIANEQIKQLREMRSHGYPLIFADTWLIITKIWFEEVYKCEPDWLDPIIVNTKIDLFLVCDTDLPWEDDPVRENGGERRLYLQQRYIDTLNKYNFRFGLVRGTNEMRYLSALNQIENLFGK